MLAMHATVVWSGLNRCAIGPGFLSIELWHTTGSVVATLVSMHFGIAASWLLGMLLYAAAMLLWRRVSA
jgi:hypothetical protein